MTGAGGANCFLTQYCSRTENKLNKVQYKTKPEGIWKKKNFAGEMTATFLVPISRREAFLKEAEKVIGRTAG